MSFTECTFKLKLQILASKTEADTATKQVYAVFTIVTADAYQTHTTALPTNFTCFIFQWPEKRHDINLLMAQK